MSQKKIIDISKARKLRKIPPKSLKKKMKNFFFSASISTVVLVIFYFSSSYSRLSVMYFNKVEFVSRSTLVELTELSEADFFLFLNLRDIEKNLELHPLIENATVRRRGINSLMIQIEEQKIVGCVDVEGEMKYVLGDGQTMSEDDGVNVVCRGIIIHGITNEELEAATLSLFVKALSEVNPIFISLIEEIRYEPQFGDDNRFSLLLKDGNIVKVNSYSMADRLLAYQNMVEHVADRLGEGVTGVFNLDVGIFFQPHGVSESITGEPVDISNEINNLINSDTLGNVDENNLSE